MVYTLPYFSMYYSRICFAGNNKQSKIPRLKNSERSDAETPQQEPSWNSEITELRNQDSIESTTESRKDSTWSEGSSDGSENGLESLACDEGLADISAPDSGICSVTLQFTPPSDDMDVDRCSANNFICF